MPTRAISAITYWDSLTVGGPGNIDVSVGSVSH
jgi:hypothetical protein